MHASPRRVSRALVTICATVATTSLIGATPSAAAPDVDQARDQLKSAQQHRHQTKVSDRKLTKRLAAARTGLHDTRTQLRAHEVALAEVEADIEAVEQDQLGLERLAQASTVVRSEDPERAYERAQDQAEEIEMAPRSAQALDDKITSLQDRETTLESRVNAMRTKARKSGASLKRINKRVSHAAAALEEARQEAREAARPTRSATRAPANPTPAAAPAASGAAAAVAYAMAQVGDSYAYGATGPDAFDCSGLTMAAWAQGGVSLPHSSGAQMGSGTPVSMSALQPGDLVFYYSPVSHVGIYVGNGQLVHAANPSTGVQITSVNSMPASGAVRPG